MTNRLIFHFPNSTIVIESDNTEKLSELCDFCKKELGAYHSTENFEEYTVDEMNEELSNKFHSKRFELNLIN